MIRAVFCYPARNIQERRVIEHLYKNWIVYVLGIGFLWFVISVYRNTDRRDKNSPGEK